MPQSYDMGNGLNADHKDSVGIKTNRRLELKSAFISFLKDNVLILITLLGIVIGFCFGLGLHAVGPSKDVLVWIGFPGELFLRSLKATIVPVIVCMVITATANLDAKSNGWMAAVNIGTYVLTSTCAVTTAVVLFLIFRPEANSLNPSNTINAKRVNTHLETQDVFLDLIRNIIPDNVVAASFSQAVTKYTAEEVPATNSTSNQTVQIIYKRSLGQAGSVNILGLITICAAIGVASNKILSRDSAFLSFFRQGQEVVLLLMHWLAWTTPIGVASLVAESIAGVDNFTSLFVSIGRLVICVIIGLAFHQVVTISALLVIITRKNPFVFLGRCMKSYFVGFATCGTSVALPHMLEACKKNNIPDRVANFAIPISVTLHADASGLYMASAALFLGQTTGHSGDLDASAIFIIACLSTVLSLAIPPVPSSSIVTIVIILTSLDFPLHGIALLFTVEWILDRLRTGVNAVSHVVCAGLTHSICEMWQKQDTKSPPGSRTDNAWDTEITIESDSATEVALELGLMDGQKNEKLRENNNSN